MEEISYLASKENEISGLEVKRSIYSLKNLITRENILSDHGQEGP